MNLLVIGAAGKTGKLVVERAIAAGHTVTALVRNAGSYQAPAGGVRVIGGDAADPAALAAAVAGQQAVVDTVGGKTPYRRTTLEQSIARAVVAAVHQHGVRRIIAVSALGVGDSVRQSSFFFRHVVLPTFLRGSTKDKAAMEQEIRQAGVDFIIVRPAVLNDHPATGRTRVFEGTEKANKITRADVAQFVVDQLSSDTYLGTAVTIANQ